MTHVAKKLDRIQQWEKNFKLIEDAHPQLRDKVFTGFQGDEISRNRVAIIEWIGNNCKGGAEYDGLAMLYTLKFEFDEDVTLFALRWL